MRMVDQARGETLGRGVQLGIACALALGDQGNAIRIALGRAAQQLLVADQSGSPASARLRLT